MYQTFMQHALHGPVWSSKIKRPRVCKLAIENGHDVRQAGKGRYDHISSLPIVRI